jgi:hypothetical protein
MTKVDSEIRALAAARHLPVSHLERWLAIDGRGREVMLGFARALRLRTGQIVEALELLDEIAVRDGTEVADILARPSLARLPGASGARPDRARDFVAGLRRMRFPRLAETTAHLEAEIAALKLPSGMRVVLPPRLSSDELTIQLRLSSAAELDRALAVLTERRERIARIIGILAGEDEV